MPATMSKEKIKFISIKQLVADPANARRTASKDADKELAESVKAQGILASLLVRPKGAKFEVVAGHRRLAAAAVAGLEEIPCQVQEMTDEEAKEKQLTENLQREDLDPIDEAEAFSELLGAGKTLDQLHSQTGKPKAYIFRRARLFKLDKRWIKALRDGELSVDNLEVVVQLLDDPADQDEYIEQSQYDLGHNDDPDETREHIIRAYMRKLSKAPWSLTEEGLAGCIACKVCPERSSAQQDLLGGAGKDDACLNSVCWKKKLAAHSARVVEKAKAEGKTVLTGEKAEAAVKNARTNGQSELVALDTDPSWWGESGTLREALKGKKVPVAVLAQGKNGLLQEMVTRKDFYAALPKRSSIETRSGTGGASAGGKLSAKEKAARRVRLLELKAKAAAWPKAVDQVVSKLAGKGVNLAQFKLFAFVMIKHHGDHHLVNEPGHRMGIKSGSYDYKNAVANHLMKAKTEKEVLSIIWNAALGSGLWDTSLTEAGKDLFAAAGVDWKAMKAAEAKALTKARAEKLAAREAQSKGGKK